MVMRVQIVVVITRSNQTIEETERTIQETRKIITQSRALVTRSIYLTERSKPLVHGIMPVVESRPKIFSNIRLRARPKSSWNSFLRLISYMSYTLNASVFADE